MACNGNPLHVGGPDGSYPVAPTDPNACDADGLNPDDLIVAASQSAEITVDNQTVKRRPLSELIALDNHLRNRCVVASSGGGGWGSVSKAKMVPPSAIGDQ